MKRIRLKKRRSCGIQIYQIVTVSFLITTLLLLQGCGEPADMTAWRQTKTINTIQAYDDFTKQFSTSPYAVEAMEKRNEMENSRKAIEAQRANVAANWSKLCEGLTIEEVDRLVGPLGNLFVRETRKFVNVAAMLGSVMPNSKAFEYKGAFYTLFFDTSGKLTMWWKH
jgi:hypothetical protein